MAKKRKLITILVNGVRQLWGAISIPRPAPDMQREPLHPGRRGERDIAWTLSGWLCRHSLEARAMVEKAIAEASAEDPPDTDAITRLEAERDFRPYKRVASRVVRGRGRLRRARIRAERMAAAEAEAAQ